MRNTAFSAIFALFLMLMPVAANAIETTAKEAVVIDVNTGAILFEKNAHERMPTSSMSKVMTIYMVADAISKGQLKLTDTLPVSERAWRMQGSKMFVKVGDQVPVEDLIKGVVVQSGNDATVVLAEGTYGTEDRFARAMTEKAHAWGMKETNFMNASGWPDPNHYSTPYDLAIMAWHIINDHPEIYKYYSIKEFTWNNIKQGNRNPLLYRNIGADGVKTGHTEIAGYGLIGSGVRGGRRVILVLNGMQSMQERADESAKLLEWALGDFKMQPLAKTGAVVAQAPVVFGLKDKLGLALGKDVNLTVPALGKAAVTMKAKFMSPLIAPIKAGDKVGTLSVSVAQVGNFEYPLVAAENIDRKGMVALTFEKILQAAKNK